MDRYLTSVLRQETQAGPGERLSFSLEGERTSQICRLRFISLSFSLSVSLCATSLQHHTVVCNSLNCHYPSPTQRGLKEPVLKATHTLKRGRISLCEKKKCVKEWMCVCVCLTWCHQWRKGGTQVSVAEVLIRATLESSPWTCVPRVLSCTQTKCQNCACLCNTNERGLVSIL